MEWKIWIIWRIAFCKRYSRLFWADHQITWSSDNPDNPPIRIYVNKTKNKIIIFKFKTGCYLEILTPGRMKLFRSTKSKITKDENGEIVLHLTITEVVLVVISAMFIIMIQESCINLFQINNLVNC